MPARTKLSGRFQGLTQRDVFFVKDVVLIDPAAWGLTLDAAQLRCPLCTAKGGPSRTLTSNGEDSLPITYSEDVSHLYT